MKPACVICQADVSHCLDGKDLCTRHFVEQYVPLSFVLHRDLPAWVRGALEEDNLLRSLSVLWPERMPHVTIHVFSRAEAHTVAWANNWRLRHDHRPKAHPDPYYERGWSSYPLREIVLLVDDTETPASLAWLLYHELSHIGIEHVPLFDALFRREDRAAGRLTYEVGDDHAHEAHADEQFCNRVATAFVGFSYDRLWWRPRVLATEAERRARELSDALAQRDEAAA